MRRQAMLILDNGMKLYQVDKNIIPFSFGNAIFINQQLHTDAELKEIIRHEFVHIKQKHTHDIIWCELLCILNWYNPFTWLIRNAVRQNLEFIADHKVLENGVSKKQYQYLLLKVIGNNHFSIANQFNFSSLKKRIAMMNKMKSAQAHLFKFLFILPLLALLLVAFRNEKNLRQDNKQGTPGINYLHPTDTIPGSGWEEFTDPGKDYPIDLVTTRGYFVHIKTEKGERIVVVEDKRNKIIESVSLAKWNADLNRYAGLYGYPVDPSAPPAPPLPPPPMPATVRSINMSNEQATVVLKNGQKENYNLRNEEEKKAFEKKYGKMPAPPPPPPPVAPHPPSTSVVETPDADGNIAVAGSARTITGVNPVKVTGTTITPVKVTGVTIAPVEVTGVITSSVTGEIAVAPVTARTLTSVSVSATSPVAVQAAHGITIPPLPADPVIWDGETILQIKVHKSTSREKMDKFIQEAKDKGVELVFDKVDYNNKNQITHFSGSMKKGNSKSTFSITDFETATLLVTGKDGKYSCLFYYNNEKEVM
jgi:hypothetical protein